MPDPTDVQYRYLLDATDFQKGAADASAAQADIGTAAQSAATTTQAANSAMAASTTTLRAQIDQNRLAMANLGVQVAALKEQKAALNTQISASVAEIGEEADETRELIRDGAMLNAQIGELSAQKASLSAATQLLTVQLGTEGDAADLSASKMIRLGAATSKVTGESIPGARGIAMLAGSMSAANAPMLALAIGGGLLVSALMSLFKAKDDNIQLSQKGFDLDIQQLQQQQAGISATQQQNVVTSDWISTVAVAIDTNNKLQAATNRQSQAQAEYDKIVRGTKEGIIEYGTFVNGMAVITHTSADEVLAAGKALGVETAARQKAQEADQTADDTLVHLYETTGQTVTSLKDQAAQLGANEETLNKFTGLVDNATSAVKNFNAAVSNMKVAEANVGATIAGLTKQADNLSEILHKTRLATNNQTDADVAALPAGENLIKSIRQRVDVLVAEGKVLGTHAAQQAEFNKLLSGYTAEQQKSVQVTEAAAAANKNWSEHAHKGGGAARAMSNELITLRKQLEDAKAAADPLNGSFDNQEAKIKADTAALEAHLAVMKRNSAEALNLASQIEASKLQAVEQKRVEAENKVWEEIAKIQAQGLNNEMDRMLQTYNAETSARAAQLRIQLGENKQTEDLIAAYALAKWGEIGQKVNATVAKAGEEGMKEAAAGMKQQGEILLKAIETPFKQGADAAKKLDDEVLKITQDIQKAAVKAGTGGFIDPMVIAQDIAQMNKLGVTLQDVNAALGHTATSEKQFEQGVQMASRSIQGQSTFLDLLQQKLNETNKAYSANVSATQEWANVSATAINQMGSEISNVFSEVMQRGTSFGEAMEAMVFKMIGSMAQQWGAYYIALGIADAFTDPAASAAELAGGAALEALGGVLNGLAGSLTSKSSTTAAASSAGSVSGGAASSNRGIPTTYVPISTTPGQTGVNITMDSSNTTKFLIAMLEKQGVYTIRNIGAGGAMNLQARRAVGAPIRGGA